jgi:hypothetical protein
VQGNCGYMRTVAKRFVSQDIFSNIKAEQRKGIKINESKISLVMKTPLGTEYSELDSFEGKVTKHDSDKALPNETFAVVLSKAPDTTILLGMTFLVKARAEIRAYNQSVTFGHFTNARTNLPAKYTFGATSSVMFTLVSEKEVIIPPTAKEGTESRPFQISFNVRHDDFDIIRDENIGGEIGNVILFSHSTRSIHEK